MARADDVRAVLRARRHRRELVRRLVLERPLPEAVAVFVLHVMGLEVRPFHVELLEHQESARETLSLAPRGYGKSTVLTVARVCVEALRDPDIRILIASKTALQAEVFLRAVKLQLESRECVAVFGPQIGRKWDTREIVVRGRTTRWAESTVTTVGALGPVASRHYELIIGDDLVDERNSRTEVQRESLRLWYYKTFYPTVVDKDSRLMLVGTRYHPMDLYGKIAKEDEDIATMVVPALSQDGTTPWPEKFSVERLAALRRKMGTAIFNAQFQNDTELMKGTIFREEWFRHWTEPPEVRADDGSVLPAWHGTDSWVGLDPAATKRTVVLTGRKAESDWWTIAACSRIVGRDAYGPEFYFRHLWRGRVTKAQYLERVRRVFAELGNVVIVACEVSGQQEHLCQDLEAVVPLRRVERTADKVSRAYRLQPFFENGQILFPHKDVRRTAPGDEDVWAAAETELALFPEADHDDLFDAIETAVMASVGGGVTVSVI